MANKAKGRKGKIGKKKAHILAYYGEHRREKSHIRRIKKHLKRFPGDNAAAKAMKELQIKAGVYREARD